MDKNIYIKKSHLRAVDKFNAELKAFADRTDEYPPVLYEDAYTSFTLWNIRVEDGVLCYEYDGREEYDTIVFYDDEEQVWFENDIDGIMDAIRFYRACLRRAIRYWEMDTERLDAIQNFEAEDIEDEDNY